MQVATVIHYCLVVSLQVVSLSNTVWSPNRTMEEEFNVRTCKMLGEHVSLDWGLLCAAYFLEVRIVDQ